MKKVLLILGLLCIQWTTQAQVKWAVKAGVGTSWIAFPKVFLQDPTNANNTWEIAPATNSGTFYLGGEMIFLFSKNHGFRSELSYNYVSGEVNVSELDTDKHARKLQTYSRIEVPLLFAVRSDDHFLFSFGPSFFFNISDNKGFEKAVAELAPNAKIDATIPWGIRARLAANIRLIEHLFLEIKFDYDLGKHFEYIGDTYEVRMAIQGITGGVTYIF